MNKIILSLICLFCIALSACAADNYSFIYINGSNNNDPQMKAWYEKGVRKLHPTMRKKFLSNSTIKKYYKNIGTLTIEEKPVIFFWGYDSKNDLDFVKDQLEVSKMVSSAGGYISRSLITQYLHDAIWVQKTHNMIPIIDELNDVIIEEANKGNHVILYGYSAGTFVTYQYMLNKLRFINIEKLLTILKADNDIIEEAQKLRLNNTCLSALSLSKGGIGTMSAEGHIILNGNEIQLKNNLLHLNEATEKYCAPEHKVSGVVNFACPLVLFYSDMADEEYDMNFYNKLLIKHILENDMFMLTVNFKEDPLGFPTSRNLTINEMENIMGLKIHNPSGVIYDNSGVWSKRLFPFAHTAYWNAKRTFSNAVVKSFVNGYKFQYDPKYQAKVIKKHKKKSER